MPGAVGHDGTMHDRPSERPSHTRDDLPSLDDLAETARRSVAAARLEWTSVDLAEAIAEAREACVDLLEARSQVVRVALPEAVSLDADERRLQQVLVNLIAQASKEGAAGAAIWIEVSIAEDTVALRVHPSRRASEVPAHHGHGLGLTLDIVKAVAHLHRGSVEVDGDAITVLWPRSRTDR
jgi:signal transduction histidine kinase